jgi:uncharacterized protein Yka (UPF0111/DUF47 family)
VFESQLASKYQDIKKKLEHKEQEIDRIKKLFVEKLRQLESSFSELGDHVIANRSIQTQRQREEAKAAEAQRDNLYRLLNSESDAQHEKTVDELNHTNQQLNDQINLLKIQCRDYIPPDVHGKLLEKVQSLEEEASNLRKDKH